MRADVVDGGGRARLGGTMDRACCKRSGVSVSGRASVQAAAGAVRQALLRCGPTQDLHSTYMKVACSLISEADGYWRHGQLVGAGHRLRH